MSTPLTPKGILAKTFHDVYERLAPLHGYTTRLDTREFDINSDNGRLMRAVVSEICENKIHRSKLYAALELPADLLVHIEDAATHHRPSYLKSVVKPTISTSDMELVLTDPFRGMFPVGQYLVVPRTRWAIEGIDHECDLLAYSLKSETLHEIEIKISKADLLADKRKRHTHESKIIKRFWFAVPFELTDFALLHIPPSAGLIGCGYTVNSITGHYTASVDVIRRPLFRGKDKPSKKVVDKLFSVVGMRYWSERLRDRKAQFIAVKRLEKV